MTESILCIISVIYIAPSFYISKISDRYIVPLPVLCTSIDIAAVSIDQAHDRWKSLRGPRFDATFAALDCYSDSLSKAFPPAKLAQPFDVVSLQFCMHYAFENVQKARCMLDNVSRWLRPGGVFIGTIPNADQLLYVFTFVSILISFVLMDAFIWKENAWTIYLKIRTTSPSETQFIECGLKIGNISQCLVTSIGFSYRTP